MELLDFTLTSTSACSTMIAVFCRAVLMWATAPTARSCEFLVFGHHRVIGPQPVVVDGRWSESADAPFRKWRKRSVIRTQTAVKWHRPSEQESDVGGPHGKNNLDS